MFNEGQNRRQERRDLPHDTLEEARRAQRSPDRVLDEYLVLTAQAGGRDAFQALAARWQKRLLAHAYRLTGDGELARDVAQDAWADIAKGLHRLSDAAAFPAWAFRIVTRRAADSIRKAQRRRRTNAAYAAEQASASIAEPPDESAFDNGDLKAALACLPRDQRAAIALFYGEDLSVAEIAAALRAPVGTIKTRLMHGREKLKSILEEGGYS